MGKTVLVSGGAGYIGSITTDLLLQKGYKIIIIDNLSTGFRQPIDLLQEKYGNDNLIFYNKDICSDLSEVFENKIDAVIHFAGVLSVDESMKLPQKYFSINVCGSQNLFTYMIDKNIKNIIFSSTCAIYGEAKYDPIDENHPANPVNVYGRSKKMVEKIIQYYGELLNFHYILLRYFNVTGASDDGKLGYSKTPSIHLTQNAVKGALGIEPFYLTYPQVDTPDKSPIRDYINIVDLANAHIKALEYLLDNGSSEIINIGTGTGDSVLEIVKKVQEIIGKRFEITKGEPRQGEYPKMVASIKKAKQVLNWEPQHSLKDSINSLIKWFTKHPKGWEY